MKQLRLGQKCFECQSVLFKGDFGLYCGDEHCAEYAKDVELEPGE